MKVFVTGATGFIGSAVVSDLLEAGHQVIGLARSDASAATLTAQGAEVIRGTLNDLEALKSGAAKSEGAIHCAFHHDFANWEEACKMDRIAIETIGGVFAGSGRPFVVSAGTAAVVTPGRTSTEEDEVVPDSFAKPRLPSYAAALGLAKQNVRASLMLLPPTVHGEGDHAFVPALINIARGKGVSAYIGDGLNRWPSVHRIDAARLFRLALESAPAGARLNAVADEGVPIKDIAGVISKRLNIPLVSKAAGAEAAEHFGFLSAIVAVDNPTSSAITRKLLGWKPTQPSLLADLDNDHYFKEIQSMSGL